MNALLEHEYWEGRHWTHGALAPLLLAYLVLDTILNYVAGLNHDRPASRVYGEPR